MGLIAGNKRVAVVAGATSRPFNGHEFQSTESDAVLTIVAAAAGGMLLVDLVGWVRGNTVELETPE